MALGGFWEIIEFAIDSSFGTHMQLNSLADTMGDLIVDATGALLVSVAAYFYLKGGSSLVMDRLVKRFVHLNKERLGAQDFERT